MTEHRRHHATQQLERLVPHRRTVLGRLRFGPTPASGCADLSRLLALFASYCLMSRIEVTELLFERIQARFNDVQDDADVTLLIGS